MSLRFVLSVRQNGNLWSAQQIRVSSDQGEVEDSCSSNQEVVRWISLRQLEPRCLTGDLVGYWRVAQADLVKPVLNPSMCVWIENYAAFTGEH